MDFIYKSGTFVCFFSAAYMCVAFVMGLPQEYIKLHELKTTVIKHSSMDPKNLLHPKKCPGYKICVTLISFRRIYSELFLIEFKHFPIDNQSDCLLNESAECLFNKAIW